MNEIPFSRSRAVALYTAAGLLCFLVDRVTKYWAVAHLDLPYQINRFMTFILVYNRGVSWSMFSYKNSFMFFVISTIVVAVVFVLCGYLYYQWMLHRCIAGEVFILAGALSNILDRVWYGGVVDFILLSAGRWSFPVFNIADMCIVAGVCIMVGLELWRSRAK